MKRRTQKLFIAMFAFLIAGFAITSAYVFDVTNWNPFGTLNLSKLIIKNLSQTGIILDSEDYTIKIDPDHNDPDGGQIRVYQICDENGQNCRAIANLYTGTQGVPGPQGNTGADGVGIQDISSEKVGKTTTVTVTYTNGETLSFDILDGNDGTSVNGGGMAFTNNSQNNYICRKSGDAVTCNGLKLSTYPQNNRLCYVKDNVLYCDQVNLFEELSGRINDVSENINNGALIIYKGGTQYTFTANQSEDKTIQLGPIGGSNGNVCIKSGDDISCNTSVKLGAMSGQKRCYYDGTKINCNQNAPEPGAEGGATGLYLTPAGINDKICIKQSDNTIYCNIAQDYYATADRLASEVAAIMSLINARTDNDTWVANAQLKSGYVAAPQKTTANKVWKTDDSGNPAWRDDATGGGTTFTPALNAQLKSGYVAAPQKTTANKVWKTDDSGNPAWRDDATGGGTTFTPALNAQLKSGYVAAPQKTTANKVWKTDSTGNPAWRDDANTWVQNQKGVDGYVLGPTTSQFGMCWKTDASGTPGWRNCGGGGGDSYRTVDTGDIYSPSDGNIKALSTLRPLRDDLPLYFYTDFYHSGAFNFYTYNSSNQAGPSTRITFDQKGLRIGNGASYGKGAGLSVGGMVTVGIGGSNYSATAVGTKTRQATLITIQATGHTEDTDRHFEILGNHELSVGTRLGAFIYFTEKTGTYASFASGQDRLAQNNQTQNRSGRQANVTQDDLFKSYMVGINTTTPQATLDIKGSIKVGSNCQPAICSKDTAGTIIYYETTTAGYVAICKKKSRNAYARYDMLNGTEMGTTPTGYNRTCFGPISPNHSQMATMVNSSPDER